MNSRENEDFFSALFGSGKEHKQYTASFNVSTKEEPKEFPQSNKDGDMDYLHEKFSRSFIVSGNINSSTSFPKGKVAATEFKLSCSLEELYSGSTKKLNFSRNVVQLNDGGLVQESEIITVDIKPGWKKGTKITFANKGNQEPNKVQGDLVFVIDEKPHAVYTRDGDDLILNHKLSLADALAGTNVNLKTLDGRNLFVPVTDIVTPGYELVVAGEGMPISKKGNGTKGNLKIKFDVKFPQRLTMEQKRIVRYGLEG